MKEERQVMEAKLERMEAKQRAEMDALREAASRAEQAGIKARMDELREAASRAGQMRDLLALQSRLETLHAAKLLADAELYAVEDIIAEEDDADERVAALITLSGKMAADGAFARQLRRKYA
jgi:hypothetical protein